MLTYSFVRDVVNINRSCLIHNIHKFVKLTDSQFSLDGILTASHGQILTDSEPKFWLGLLFLRKKLSLYLF